MRVSGVNLKRNARNAAGECTFVESYYRLPLPSLTTFGGCAALLNSDCLLLNVALAYFHLSIHLPMTPTTSLAPPLQYPTTKASWRCSDRRSAPAAENH